MPNHDYRPDLMGSAEVLPQVPIVAGAWANFKLTYTAGKFGIDDLGGIRVATRTHSDMTPLQTTDPSAPGYLTVEASNGAKIEYEFQYKRNIRPWGNAITVLCRQFLKPGDQLIFRIGDTRQGSPGVRMQTHCESHHQFRVTVDAFASVDFTPIEEHKQPFVKIVPGKAVVWKALLPTLRRTNEPFRLVVKLEDRWGNPSDQFDGLLTLKANGLVKGLPKTINLSKGEFSVVLDNLSISKDGTYEVDVYQGETYLTRSNPLRVEGASPFAHYWSDMHGQSGETIGTGTAREYFEFARDKGFVDIAGHQGNDFQISDAFWLELNRLSAEFNDEGKFLCLPGYEWSGNTGLGGDHNVWYRKEGRPIYRSSRALISDKANPETDCHDVKDLFAAIQNEDVLIVPHVGGRFADVAHAHNATVEPSIEVHSAWGTFDWLVQDSMNLGYRVGIVASSDGHKGRPGASYPGDAKFGSYGGLTCHLLPKLTRDCLFEEFRRRHHFATTGARLFLSATMAFDKPARIFMRNPEFEHATSISATEAIMGDIVQTTDATATFKIDLATQAAIERVEIYDGMNLLKTVRCFDDADLGKRLRIICKGQENRGRGRLVQWQASALLKGASVSAITTRNYYNPDKQPHLENARHIIWSTVTTGGFSAIDVWLEYEDDDATLKITTNHGDLTVKLADIDAQTVSVDCGGMDKSLSVQRLPEALDQRSLSIEHSIDIPEQGDAAIYARVNLEDGHVAWSSPIYAFRQAKNSNER